MKLLPRLLALATLALTATFACALKPGDPAPDFHGTDSNNRPQTLSQYLGKWVVLEWANKAAPLSKSTTTPAIWSVSSASGPPKASSG